MLSEKEAAVKKCDEIEVKINEKDTKIGQMNNFLVQMKTKNQAQQKMIDEQKKQVKS